MIEPIETLEQYDHDENEDNLFNSPDEFYKVVFLVSMTFIICYVRSKLKYS